MFKDGAQGWEAKDFLVEQDRCEEVVIESKSYPGRKATPSSNNDDVNTKVEL